MPYPTTILPFQPAAMSTAQLAAVSYLARYSGRTHVPPHAPQELGLLADVPAAGHDRLTQLIRFAAPT